MNETQEKVRTGRIPKWVKFVLMIKHIMGQIPEVIGKEEGPLNLWGRDKMVDYHSELV